MTRAGFLVAWLVGVFGGCHQGVVKADLKEAAALLDVISQTTLNQVATDDDQHVRVVV